MGKPISYEAKQSCRKLTEFIPVERELSERDRIYLEANFTPTDYEKKVCGEKK